MSGVEEGACVISYMGCSGKLRADTGWTSGIVQMGEPAYPFVAKGIVTRRAKTPKVAWGAKRLEPGPLGFAYKSMYKTRMRVIINNKMDKEQGNEEIVLMYQGDSLLDEVTEDINPFEQTPTMVLL